MKKRLVAILLTVFVLMLTGCGNSNSEEEPNEADSQMTENQTEENGVISAEEAEKILREYLVSVNILKSDYVLELSEPILGKFENGQIFRFEIWYDGGERLLAIYGVTTDGEKIYEYNPADDEWVEQIIGNVSTEGVADYPALDGVTMEVTECSDTSVTVKITNDTDKDIECGDDFCLKVLDEESGEWQELDTVIDSYGFHETAHMIIKDSPYETAIDFEWLYGKLEPGRYQITKTVMVFRETGDHTSYAFTAEFTVN